VLDVREEPFDGLEPLEPRAAVWLPLDLPFLAVLQRGAGDDDRVPLVREETGRDEEPGREEEPEREEEPGRDDELERSEEPGRASEPRCAGRPLACPERPEAGLRSCPLEAGRLKCGRADSDVPLLPLVEAGRTGVRGTWFSVLT
jgi:hypothetical protein